MPPFVSRKIRLLAPTTSAAIGLISLVLSGCGAPPTETGSSGTGGAPSCAPGQVNAGLDGCVEAGIQGCAAPHIGDDGVCRPLPESCPKGTIPHFEKGCVPVGIQGCAPQFIGEDGLCRPTLEACPAGTIPRFDQGCLPVGIQDCPPAFLEGDGLCHVRMAKCPAGTFATPRLGCAPVDGPSGCGSGTWGALADVPGTLYVAAGADPMGADGSQAKPFATVAAALTAAPSGGRIALAAGEYEESLHITKPVSIAGRCASMVSITGTQPGPFDNGYPVIVWVQGVTDTSLAGLRIEGAGGGVLLDDAKATIEDAHIRGVSAYGVLTWGASSEGVVRRTLMEDLSAGPPSASTGMVLTQSKSSVTVEDSAIYHSLDLGLAAAPGTKLACKGVLVEEPFGQGRGAELYTTASFEDSALVAAREPAVLAFGPATVTLTRVAVEETGLATKDSHGYGLQVSSGATVEVIASLISKSYDTGIHVGGGALTVRQSLLADNGVSHGAGVQLQAGSATIEDSAVVRTSGYALALNGGSQATATRSLLDGTVSAKDGYGGPALFTGNGASKAVLSDCALTDNQKAGLFVEGPASAELVRCLVEGTRPDAGGFFGVGAAAWGAGSSLSLRGSVVAHNRHIALDIHDGASLHVEESWISGTRASGEPGGGLGAQLLGGTVEILGSLLSDNRNNHLVAFGSDSALSVQGSVFLGAPTEGESGRGIFATQGATLQMTSSLVRSAAAYAVYLDGASATLSMCTIEKVIEQRLAENDATLVGDGFLSARSAIDAERVLISDCPRAGIFLWDATGSLKSTVSTRNRFGVVLEGTAPELAPDAVFFANTDEDKVPSGDLPVPNGPSPLPSP